MTREPGGTPLGERLRRSSSSATEMSPWAEAALFAAARAELVERVDPPGARARRDGDLRPLHRLLARLPGRGARARRRPRPRAQPRRDRRSAAGRHFVLQLDAARRAGPRRGGAPDRIEREQARVPRAGRGRLPRAARRFPERITAVDGTLPTRSRSRRSCVTRVDGTFLSRPRPPGCSRRPSRRGRPRVPLLRAAWGRQAGDGARVRRGLLGDEGASSAARIPTSTCWSPSATRSGSTTSASSAATSTCARSRGIVASTSSSMRRRSTRTPPTLCSRTSRPPAYAVIVLVAADLGPLRRRSAALPARPLPPPLRADRSRLARRARPGCPTRSDGCSPASRVEGSIARRRCWTPTRRTGGRHCWPSRRPSTSTRISSPPPRRRPCSRPRERGAHAKEVAEAELEELDLTTREAEQRARRAQRGAEREELLASLDELAAWYRDLVAVAAGAARPSSTSTTARRSGGTARSSGWTGPSRAVGHVRALWRDAEELNVNASLSLEALFVRLRRELAPAHAV